MKTLAKKALSHKSVYNTFPKRNIFSVAAKLSQTSSARIPSQIVKEYSKRMMSGSSVEKINETNN
jgi:hypothetical protein